MQLARRSTRPKDNMKDWNNLIADVDKILPSGLHNTAGREGHKIDFVGIHHNAGNGTIDSCYNN